MKRILVLSIVFLASSGCATRRIEEPPWPIATPLTRPAETVGAARQSTSLWSDGASLTAIYDDRRARRVGDLVTVLVVEASEASREASTGVSRDASVDANVGAFLGSPLDFGLPHLYGSTGFQPTVKAETSNSFKGQGTTKRKDVLRTRVAARVVNILEDGNLVIEGRRQVRVNEENQYLFVHGIARPIDISPTNTIASTDLAEAQVLYGGTGLLAAQQKPGWLYRVMDAVWPF
jgi:flagellar L-ring protein precursor FlgH